jgi:uncharacterized protein YfbU (UPF0304 family)
MQLSRGERWVLWNQLQLQARLDPDKAEGYRRGATALAGGYEAEYDALAAHIRPEGLDTAECLFVREVLAMYAGLQAAYAALPAEEQEEVDPDRLQFWGFDGTKEPSYRGYARWLMEAGCAFPRLLGTEDLDSHMATLGRYRNMLAAWRLLATRERLTPTEICLVAETGW